MSNIHNSYITDPIDKTRRAQVNSLSELRVFDPSLITIQTASITLQTNSLSAQNASYSKLVDIETAIQAVETNQTDGSQLSQIKAADSPSIDAFGRWRVSSPETIFDSKNVFDDPDLASSVENQPLYYDNQETAGSGTSTTYNSNQASQSISVSNATAGTRIRQTRMRFNYQPGKSQLVLMTFIMATQQSGITQREGLFDGNNGLFLEDNGSAYRFVRRTYTSGSAVDNAVAQSSWNLDTMDGNGPSGITLDFAKTQILYMDMEWLGVGRVRMGFVIDGKIYYAHEFLNTNVLALVYTSTPNLPLRSEITNSGVGGAASLVQICSSVVSEGGLDPKGITRYASTNGTEVTCSTENITYAILGIKLRTAYIGTTIDIQSINLQIQNASKMGQWSWRFNPTVAGTFTYAAESQSAVQIARGATANTVTGGYILDGGFAESGGPTGGKSGSASAAAVNSLHLGSLIDGTLDSMVLCFTPRGGTSGVAVEAGVTWRELL